MRHFVEAWLSAGVRAIPVLFVVGCAEPLLLEGRHCPCVAGYQCCETGNLCLPETETCPVWKSLDPATLEGFNFDGGLTGWTFEVMADGTPYLAVLHCEVDDCFDDFRHVPTVLRYENDAWTILPSEGLPETMRPPGLIVDTEGTLHLLSDVSDDAGLEPRSIVSSFDGQRWEERFPAVLGAGPAGLESASSPFELDASNRLYTTTFNQGDPESSFSVLRFERSDWRVLGTDIALEQLGVQLAVRDDSVCVTHPDIVGNTLLRCLEGSEWRLVREFEQVLGRGFYIGPDGTLFVVTSEFIDGRVLFGKGDDWRELPPIQCQGAQLVVTTDGVVYFFGQGFEVPTRFAFWDRELDDWSYFTNAGIDEAARSAMGAPKLEIAAPDKTPYLAFMFYGMERSTLRVYKHE